MLRGGLQGQNFFRVIRNKLAFTISVVKKRKENLSFASLGNKNGHLKLSDFVDSICFISSPQSCAAQESWTKRTYSLLI